MEATFLSEIVNGNTAVIAIAILFLYYMHKQAMEKIDTLTEAITGLATGHAVHKEKLDNGEKRFVKLESHLDKHDEDLKKIRDHLHDVKNTMITSSQMNELFELHNRVSKN